jgi:hypothetical protein
MTPEQESFDRLLAWLDGNNELAKKKYENLRYSLIKMFTSRGCIDAEELADETINRVARQVKTVGGNYVGDPAYYFYGVAKKVYLEYLKGKGS